MECVEQQMTHNDESQNAIVFKMIYDDSHGERPLRLAAQDER